MPKQTHEYLVRALNMRTTRTMKSGLEQRFAERLEVMLKAGEIRWWAYEPMKFHIGANRYYTPDFAIVDNDSHMVFYELKGRVQEASKVRMAATWQQYPMFRFYVVTQRSARDDFRFTDFQHIKGKKKL